MQADDYPHQLVLDIPLGTVECAFADPETLYFALPSQPIGVRFDLQAEQAATDRRGGTFRGVRNTACTLMSHFSAAMWKR